MNVNFIHGLMGKKRAFLKDPVAKSRQRIRQLWVSVREFVSPSPLIDQPIIVTGTARSNTTFLSECLGQHPQIHTYPNELVLDWERFAQAPMGCPFGEEEACPPRRSREISIEVLEGIRQRLSFRNAIVANGIKGHFLNHNPHLVNKLPLVYQAFPQATLIITSRDIRSNVASLKVFWEQVYREFGVLHYLPPNSEACWSCFRPSQAVGLDKKRLFPGGDVAVLAEYWLRMNRLMEKDVGSFQKFIPVKHRDLLEDPQGFLQTLTKRLGLHPFEYNLNTVDFNRNHRWQKILNQEDRRSLEQFLKMHLELIQNLHWADNTL